MTRKKDLVLQDYWVLTLSQIRQNDDKIKASPGEADSEVKVEYQEALVRDGERTIMTWNHPAKSKLLMPKRRILKEAQQKRSEVNAIATYAT